MGLHHTHTSSEWRRNWPLSTKASHSPEPRHEKKAPGKEAPPNLAHTKEANGSCSVGKSDCLSVWDLSGCERLGFEELGRPALGS